MHPKILGFLTVGTGLLPIWMGSSIPTSLDHVVKAVAVDFAGAIDKFLSKNHLLSFSRYLFISLKRGRIFNAGRQEAWIESAVSKQPIHLVMYSTFPSYMGTFL